MIETCIAVAFVSGAILLGSGLCWVKWRRIERRQADQIRNRVAAARAKILADGKIEGPKGKFIPRRWGRKWVEYANSIPTPHPRAKTLPSIRELPNYPHAGTEK